MLKQFAFTSGHFGAVMVGNRRPTRGLRGRARATCSVADLVAEAARSGEQGAITARGAHCIYIVGAWALDIGRQAGPRALPTS
jgi:hypothetical protein